GQIRIIQRKAPFPVPGGDRHEAVGKPCRPLSPWRRRPVNSPTDRRRPMAEPLKNLLHPGLVKEMATHISRAAPDFDGGRCTGRATAGMDALELMQRADRIRRALAQTLPADYPAAADSLRRALPAEGRPGLSGWALLPANQFVSEYGLAHFDLS